VVAVNVWYHVGSKDEQPGRTGFAHLFEHMMFQGSANIGKAEHMRFVERAGGSFNGSTTWDRTNYFETLPSNYIELALWLESDRMSSLDVSRENLDNQREVVKEERRWRVDNRPYGTAWERLFSLAYKRHPYHWPVVGYMSDLEAATVDDVRKFFSKFYVPNNAVLTVTGDFKIDKVEKLITKYFAPIPEGESLRKEFLDEPPPKRGFEHVRDGVSLPAVYLGFRIPPMTSGSLKALNIAAGILTEGDSSRLYRKLVYEKRMAKSVDAFAIEMEHPGLFVVSSVVSTSSRPDEVRDIMTNELKRLSTELPSERELEKVKNQLVSRWIGRMSKAMSRADNLAHYSTFFGDASEINTHISCIRSVTREEVSEAALKFLAVENYAEVTFLPKDYQEKNILTD